MNLLAKLILKDFRVSFLYFFIQKKMLAKFTNIKKYRAIIWALSESKSVPIATSTIIIGVISIIIGVLFVFRQKSESEPMVPSRFFKSKSFNGGNIATFLLYASMYGVVFFLPQYFQVVNHSNALILGLKLLPWTGTLVIIAPFAGSAVDKFGERFIATIGLVLQGIGYLWIALAFHPAISYLLIVLPLVLAGTGLSMAGPALQKSAIGSVKETKLVKHLASTICFGCLVVR